MNVAGEVMLEDILDALNLDEIPSGCPVKNVEMLVRFDDVMVDDDEAFGCLPEEHFRNELRDINRETLTDLSAAIRRGDRCEAEHLLDGLFGEDRALIDAIQLGRYRLDARRMRAA